MKVFVLCAFLLCLLVCSQVEGFVTECYYAQQSSLVTKQKCGLGYDVCLSSTFTTGGVVNMQKNCNKKLLAQNNCNSINNLFGGHCYMCETNLCNMAW